MTIEMMMIRKVAMTQIHALAKAASQNGVVLIGIGMMSSLALNRKSETKIGIIPVQATMQ